MESPSSMGRPTARVPACKIASKLPRREERNMASRFSDASSARKSSSGLRVRSGIAPTPSCFFTNQV